VDLALDDVGLSCVDGEDELLLRRLVDERGDVRGAMVVDVLEIAPSFCTATEILGSCDDGGCPRVPGLSRCFDLDLEGPIDPDDPRITPSVVGELLYQRLAEEPALFRGVPTGGAMLRFTLAAGSCEAPDVLGDEARAALFTRESLIGCMVSCPAPIEAIDEPLVVTLPVSFTGECSLGEVQACALVETR